MNTLHQVFYVSRSLAAPADLAKILEASRRLNLMCGITGALVFTGGHFAQLLEGPTPSVAETMIRIDADIRHEHVTRLIDADTGTRRFETWTMAFVEAVGADDLLEELLLARNLSEHRVERVLKLLLNPPSQD